MLEFLLTLDRQIFYFVNVGCANPITDLIMPAITSDWVLRIAYAVAMIVLMWKGNRERRILVVSSIIVIAITDLVVSSLLKPLIDRPRPCHVLTGIHLLVNCGAGLSMPSSHAANAFGQAAFWGMASRRWRWQLLILAFLVAISRVFVGVHYPADVLVGSAVGALLGAGMYLLVSRFIRRRTTNRI
jgi:membrane-associated phospholipid phosphatase